ncbi:MAG TPA: hypothetical protein EYP33_00800, partial [Pyrodictium sp.]|nr:hypothetical protein [Pyrodictium sp.]
PCNNGGDHDRRANLDRKRVLQLQLPDRLSANRRGQDHSALPLAPGGVGSVAVCDALVWIAGDVTGYSLVNYATPDGKLYTSFVSAAALAEATQPSRLAVIVPETLFEDNHCGSYRLLLEAKAGANGRQLLVQRGSKTEDATTRDKLAEKLLARGFDCYVAPHPGVAAPLRVLDKGGKVLVARGGRRRYPGYSFHLVFSLVYTVLRRYAARGSTVCLDLTHGSNVLVSAALLAASLLPIVHGARLRVYAAPVLGRPGDDPVEFLDMTGSAALVREIAAGAAAWSMLDERLLPLDLFHKAGRQLGPGHREVYGKTATVLRMAEALLWGIRSGQAPILRGTARRLAERLPEARDSLDSLIEKEYPVDENPHTEKWVEHSAMPPWVPLADTVITLTAELLRRLGLDPETHQEPSNRELVERILQEMLDKGYPDRALSVAREWLVATLLANSYTRDTPVPVGGEEWQRIEQELRRRGNQLAQAFEKARQLRNRLMHGRISKEEQACIVVDGDDIHVKTCEPTKQGGTRIREMSLIDRETVEQAAHKLLEAIKTPRDTTGS